MTASAPVDITQCAIDCSTYCSVLPLKMSRGTSAWKKQAEMPTLMRSRFGAPHRLREQALEIGRGDRLRIGLVADVGAGDGDEARDRVALHARGRQRRRD